MEFNKDGKKFVLELKENKKKYNPKKVPKKLYIKIKTNIEKFKTEAKQIFKNVELAKDGLVFKI